MFIQKQMFYYMIKSRYGNENLWNIRLTKNQTRIEDHNQSTVTLTLHNAHKTRQGTVNFRTFAPTNESADCWYAQYSCNFNIRVKSMQQIKSILLG